MRSIFLYASIIVCSVGLILAGCSTARHRHDPEQVRNTPRPAYSLHMQQTDMVVAVSPVRQTMQIGGRIPAVLGAGVSAVQDNRHAVALREAVGEYDPGEVFKERTTQAVEDHFANEITRILPQGTSAGFANAREARAARLAGLRRTGYDMVLDLDLTFGIYGPEGILAAQIAGTLTDVPSGRVQWRNEIAWYSTELFADIRWRDPMERMVPNYFSPRFSSDRDAVDQWTREDGKHLRTTFEEAVDGVTAAILTDLGLQETPEGLYTLGVHHLLNGREPEAAAAFVRTLELAPEMYAARNGLVVALIRDDQADTALTHAKKLVEAAPDYMPGHYNLAWCYAVEKNAPEKARPHYERAVALGASPSRRLERAMRPN